MRSKWNWRSAIWNEDLLPHDSDRDMAKRVNHGQHCNVWGLISYRTSTLTVTCSPIYSICTVYFLCSTAEHKPSAPSAGTKGALSILDWNIVEMQSAHTLGISFVAGEFYQANMQTVLPVLRNQNTLDMAYTKIRDASQSPPHNSALLC